MSLLDKLSEKIAKAIWRTAECAPRPEGRYAIYDKETICIFWGVSKSGEAIVEFQSKSGGGFRYHFEKVDPKKIEVIAGHDKVDFDEIKDAVMKIPAFKGAFK